MPHGQAVPLVYTIDMDNCIQCYKCVDACGKLDAIDFSQQAEGSSSWRSARSSSPPASTSFDPARHRRVRLRRLPERASRRWSWSAWPTRPAPPSGRSGSPLGRQGAQEHGHHPVRGLARQPLQRVLLRLLLHVHDQERPALKQTHPEMDITIFYMDIRTPAKGYEEFYKRARAAGHLASSRGVPPQITEDPRHAQPLHRGRRPGPGRRCRVGGRHGRALGRGDPARGYRAAWRRR